ncbi:uncharacterized protein LOC132637072 [Lycium barbarum]|uniref:uncharacterized protein LOC132637072 n=1 Tax=Lycium barbarum TaxID=112863 RepID=UPI00293E3F37|nr:uncharacterized protein LOC132637072 [Lycium barbarum]
MLVNDHELSVVITGRCPSSFTADGSPIYGEMSITDDESLSSFLRCPEIFKNHICIAALDMYATVQRSTQVKVLIDNEFDFGGTTYFPSLNIDFPRGVVQQRTINRETGGPSNATTQLHNLNCNVRHPSHPGPSELDSDRYVIFHSKKQMKGAVRLYNIAHKKEFKMDQAKGTFWKVICKRHEKGCSWMIRFSLIGSGMWKAGKVIELHNCDTNDYTEDHFNLNSNMIATSLIPFVMTNAQISIKFVQETIKGIHHYTPNYRKAQKGHKKAFEMVYGDFESSFRAWPRYMATLEHFNPGTIVEWTRESTTMQGEHIFKYLFWAFKPSIDRFKSCRPVISIDGTHVYGKYEMKLLIVVGIDANGNFFPPAYAIVARESYES